MRKRATTGRLIAALLSAAIAWPAYGRAAAPSVTGADVNRAIVRGLAYLRRTQQADGSWRYRNAKYNAGATALAVFTLVTAGVPPHDRTVRAGARYIARTRFQYTYCTALAAMALAAVDPDAHRDKIVAARDWLIFAMQPGGGWGYGRNRGERVDNSNTQFAVLGLRAAQEAGHSVPNTVWESIDKYFRKIQRRDGGWGYRTESSYGSMTAAGLGSLIICGAQAEREIRKCGQHAYDGDVFSALKWFDRHFSVEQNPGKGNWEYYYLYAVERVGVLSARRYLGGRDWYREGAHHLLAGRHRQRPDGRWGGDVAQTCFGLLFLAKGKAPVLVHKLRRKSDWNNDPNDIRNLCAYFGQVVGQKVSWQIVDHRASLEDLLAAPVLYLNGHKSFEFSPGNVEKLRQFITQGGFIFAEACCGRKEFDRSFRALMRQLFPDRELTDISPEHPVYRAFFKLAPDERSPLMGLRASCRTSVIYSPEDLSCRWEKVHKFLDDPAFKVGVNVLAYATGLEPLRDKLDEIEIIKPTKSGPAPRGAFILAQVKHGGDWEPDTRSTPGLLQFMSGSVNLDVASDKTPVALTNPDLFDYAALYLVGHFPLAFAPEEEDRLKLYLERGGFLFAESCCGNEPFDKSFRELVAKLLPEHELQRLPAGHPVFSTGFPIEQVVYKKAVLEKNPHLKEPWLEAITIEGRIAVIYSKFSLGCAWENHPCHGCKGLQRDDALKLGTNVILYGLTN